MRMRVRRTAHAAYAFAEALKNGRKHLKRSPGHGLLVVDGCTTEKTVR